MNRDRPEGAETRFNRIDPVFEQWRDNPQIVERLGELRTSIVRYNGNDFPNLFMIDRLLMLRTPIGPGETEIRAIGLYDQTRRPKRKNCRCAARSRSSARPVFSSKKTARTGSRRPADRAFRRWPVRH